MESRVGLVNQHLGDNGAYILLDPAVEQLVLQCLLQLVTDRPLAVRTAHIQRNFVHTLVLGGNLGPAQDETNLRAIAMPDSDIPPGSDHVCHVTGSLAQRIFLVFNGNMLGITDKRITADGNDGDFRFWLFIKSPVYLLPVSLSTYTPTPSSTPSLPFGRAGGSRLHHIPPNAGHRSPHR